MGVCVWVEFRRVWLKINFHGWGRVDQVGLKLTQSPSKAGVEVRTELGNYVKEFCEKTNGVGLCQAQNC